VVAKRINGNDSPRIVYNANHNKVLNNLDFSFDIGPLTINWFVVVTVIVVIAACFVLYRTRFGMRLMACGEHPQAADSVGINVYKMRWSGVLISGFLGGIGGMAYIVPAVGDWNFEAGVAGMGFLALAVMIFGQWKPLNIAIAAVFFAVFRAMANIFDSISFLNALNWPKEIYNMMPFAASMIVLAFTSKNSRAPKAEGVPYDKGSR
jgi:simple sugar transport system permease protein